METSGLVLGSFLLGPASQLDLARVEAAFQTSSDAFFDVDLDAGTISWSRAVRLLLGHDPARLGDRLEAWQHLIHPDDAAALRESGRRALPAAKEVWSEEFRLARVDGTYAPVRVRAVLVRGPDGRSRHLVGSVTDLSELREREAELRRLSQDLTDGLARERRERARADSVFELVTWIALADWDLATDALRLSPSAESMLGHPVTEIRDLDAAMRIAHPKDGPRALAEVRNVIESGGSFWSGRVRFERPDDIELLIDVRARVIRDADGHAVEVIGMLAPGGAAEPGPSARPPRLPTLTARQRNVLELIRAGRSNKEIAGELGMSEQAAKVQVGKLMRKFGVPNRAALAALGEV
jgi:PAS domain S-box-containing protein